MLSSIHPLGERGRNSRWWLTASFHVAGGAVGGALTGLGFGLVGIALVAAGLSLRVAAVLLVVATALAWAADTGRAGLRVWSIRRQVDETWLTTYRGWVYGGGFGFQLGLGFTTIITSAATYAFFASLVLVGQLPAAIAAGVLFGTVRGAAVLTTRSINSPAELRSFHQRLADRAVPIERATVGLVAVSMAVGIAGLAAT